MIVLVALIVIGGGIGLGLYLMNKPGNQSQSTSLEDVNKPTSEQTKAADEQAAQQQAQTLAGTQMRARDTERQTDINSIATQLEVYYNNTGYYPSFEQLSDDTWVEANLVGIDLEALRPPTAKANAIQNTATPDKSHYGYTIKEQDPQACPDDTYVCSQFALYWYQESTGKILRKDSLN